MEQNLEGNIPFILIILGFVALTIISNFIRRKLRNGYLTKQGQISLKDGNIRRIEERIAGNKSWSTGKIRSEGRMLMYLLWFVGLFWTIPMGIGFVKNLTKPDATTGQKVALGVFMTLGLIPLYFAYRVTRQRLKYGESWCSINGKAGVIGKEMSGLITTKSDIKALGDFTATIECIETRTSGTGKEKKTHTSTVWQTSKSISYSGRSSRAGIPFQFELPHSSRETGSPLAVGDIHWQLKIKAPAESIDYFAIFIVPVFKMD